MAPAALAAIKEDRLAREDAHSAVRELELIRELLTTGDDGLDFVDYLTAFGHDVRCTDSRSEEERAYKLHKEHVAKNLTRFAVKGPTSSEAVKFS